MASSAEALETPINGLPSPPKTPSTKARYITRMDDELESSSTEVFEDISPGQPNQQRSPRPPKRTSPSQGRQNYPCLSKPLELLRSSYDVVVIGSGYGGAIAASRMARTGKSVCVLERGKEKWPGQYPTGMVDCLDELHYSGKVAPFFLNGKQVNGGDPTGMFHLIFGKGQHAFVGNGLGGTSLINANVFMEADEATLAMKAWPPEICKVPGCLDKYYKKVADVLEPQQYPNDWPGLAKADLFQKQAQCLGLGHKFYKVRQTTRFHNGPNSCGVEMRQSDLTGQDCTGLNDGSKTTTLVTYLADAWNWGAEIFCESEVRYVEKAPDRDGYLIHFAWHGRNRGHFKANLHDDLMWVHAKEVVFLGAGAIGTTEILLRSRVMGLSMSDRLGQDMSGNGDMLAFGYNTCDTANSVASGTEARMASNPVGPCITSVIDDRLGHDNALDGYVIQEGAVPHALSHFLQAMLDLMPGSIAPEGTTILERARAALARYSSRLLGPYHRGGAINRTQVYLVMSHDSNQAVLTLENNKPVLEFFGVGRSGHVQSLNHKLAQATRAVGGTLVQNPFFALMGQQQITVHPIGGACMARDGSGRTGVTNHVGQVFTGHGRETYPGLIVTDGALIPTALGCNPFATIAALAERAVEHYATANNLVISNEKNGLIDLFGQPRHAPARNLTPRLILTRTDLVRGYEFDRINEAKAVIMGAHAVNAGGFGFTEVMSGYIHYDEDMKDDERTTYEQAYRRAKSLCEGARFFLSAHAFNTRTMVHGSQHRGMLTGTLICPCIRGSPFMVQRGEFNLFTVDLKAPGTRNLTYDFDMTGIDGNRYHFHGYKVVDSSVALSPKQFWRSTSTLYCTVSQWSSDMMVDLDDEDAWRRGKPLAKGIMHIRANDFLSEILTMTPTGSGLLKKAMSAASFLTFFTRKSLSLFLAPLTPLQYPSVTYIAYINNTPPTESLSIVASDGVATTLHYWEPTAYPNNDPGNIRNLFMIPGASVDHQIYALPTIPFNAVNYFRRAGYRVFVTVHRIGRLMVAQNSHTTFDARLDLRACLETIRARHGSDKVYCISHCMGSVAFSSGLLDGTIPSEWILGITASQVFMNPIWQPGNMVKASLGPIPLDQLYSLVTRTNWFNCHTSRHDTLVQFLLNQLLRFYPDWRCELCNNATCHRTTLVFGRCWNHSNLNEATHRQIDRFFGGVNMRLLQLLMRMGRDGHVMGNGPLFEPLTTPRGNIERLRGIPIFLFVGRDNAVLSPEATERTYEILRDRFATGEYRRRIVPSYGHLDCWMGRNAWRDVYPMVREEVDRVVRGEAYRFEEPDDQWREVVETGDMVAFRAG